MCGRFTLLADKIKIKERFGIRNEFEFDRPNYNIAPGQNVLAVIFDGREKRAGYLRWGLVPSWAKDEKIGYKMINARSETAHVKPSFKHLMTKKRCLVIADSFYEWQQTDEGKVPKRIQLKNRGLFAFAGLWDKWEKKDKKIFTCTLLTTEADEYMRNFHHRMPIILPKEREDDWLKTSFHTAEEAQQFLKNIESDPLTAYTVSDYVNNARNNDAACIQPIE